MTRILALSFFPAFTPPLSGGESRLYNFYFELSRSCKVTLITSSHLSETIEEINHTNSFKEIRVGKDNFFVRAWAELDPYKGNGDLSGPALAASSKNFTKLHDTYLKHYEESDLIIHESPFLYDYDLFKYCDKKKRIYNSYNCEYLLYKKLHENAKSNLIADLVKSLEIRILNEVDLITYCSEDDLHEFEKLINKKINNSLHVPNGMVKSKGSTKYSKKLNHIVFMGSSHLPNKIAANFIVSEISKKCPEYNFDIVGSCLDVGNYPKNIFRHGVVSNEKKIEILSSATLAINPLDSGSGSSLKNFDYISHDLPILSTLIGMRGVNLEQNEHFYASSIDEFPKKIKELLSQPNQITITAKKAKKITLDTYSWENISNNFYEHILEIFPAKEESEPLILALNDYDPFVGTGGGCTRIRGLYLNASKTFKIIFLNFSSLGNFEIKKINSQITQISIPKTEAHVYEENDLNAKFHISINDLMAYKHCAQNNIFSKIYQIIKNNASLIVCEHPYMASLPEKFNDAFVYSSHNYELGLKKESLEWHPNKEMLIDLAARAEGFCCMSSSLIFSVSDEDSNNFLKNYKTLAPIITIRNGCDSPVEPTKKEFELISNMDFANSVVFIGSSHMPNVDAGKYIIENLAPNCPKINFHIIGTVCDALKHLTLKNVTFWGEVSNSLKSAIMQSCHSGLNPVFSGSGSNVKVADYFANGLHVFTTKFGIRGYPEETSSHITIVDENNFQSLLNENIVVNSTADLKSRSKRKILFEKNLSSEVLSRSFTTNLLSLLKVRKKILFVTYRFTSPALGGAESMLLNLISRLDKSDDFLIDIVYTNITNIQEISRFSSKYSHFNNNSDATSFRNTRFLKCEIDNLNARNNIEIEKFWLAQSEFEKKLFLQFDLKNINNGLCWGWCSPQISGIESSRWTLNEFGIYATGASNFIIRGFVNSKRTLRIVNSNDEELFHSELDQFFEINFMSAGITYFYISCNINSNEDPRPLGAFINHVQINGEILNLGKQTLLELNNENLLTKSEWMRNASDQSRLSDALNLTKLRGPKSSSLENYINNYANKYDLILTHNVVFNTARIAIDTANKEKIPSILIPHAHLDDDFYHFPDHYEMAKKASLVLASPKDACSFYRQLGVKETDYLPAGIDISEKFLLSDISEFNSLYNLKVPFFLIVGRKSGAKGYQSVIDSIERINMELNINLVMIGPDDDGFIINSKYVTYLGEQPRSVIRGALQRCIALVNMSTSESFGIVLLEAWLANKPVIANINCRAFHDLAEHRKNSLLVDKENLLNAIRELSTNNELCNQLATNGRKIAESYSWDSITEILINKINKLLDGDNFV